ncbi:MAG: glutamine synthetase [Chloroflexi bacterium]|nr:glutamine synthetase [Chloroflexota bacterium]
MSASTSAGNDRLNEIEKQIALAGIEFVRFEQTDTHGISRSKTVPVRHFRRFAEAGLNFLLGQQLLEELEGLGYRLYSGFEYEFYIVDAATHQPPFPGIQIFATLRNNFNEDIVYQILRGMAAVGVDIITANAEYGPGQMEINFAPAWGITAADNAFTFKNGVKEIAQCNGMMASFMTKPRIDQSANGCHFHQSLWQDNKNVFLDPASPNRLSKVAHQFLAGQVAHAPALCAFAAPTVNCPKRFKLYSFAPTNVTWGFENRTTGFRVKATGDERTHLENRLGCGSSNPYLLMAACLAAGLDGLKNKLEPPAVTNGIAYGLEGVTDLPARLDDALDALEQDQVLKDALGPELVKLFVAVKRHEIGKAKAAIQDYGTTEFNERVDDWERNEYFEFL